MSTCQDVSILDCTIRDGGYVVDFQFTKEDTFVVAKGLASAGIKYIEVGHGVGLNGSNSKGAAAESDEDYIRAGREAVTGSAKIGSFFIPGIGRKDDILAAREAGLDFIRLGIDVDDCAKIEPYVELSKSLGLEVWANMMKSYLVEPEQFGDIARRVGEFGVDVVTLVDSAGGMTPNDVAAYTTAALSQTKTPLAFHGHNNLTLAVANCLRFVEAGGRFVDGSLAGLGRSGGNAATELLAALLTQQRMLTSAVDWEYLVEFADSVMQFCAPGHTRARAAEIAIGLNYFHSSFSHIVDVAVTETGASLFKTLLRLPKTSRKKTTSEVAHAAALEAIRSRLTKDSASAAGYGRLERTQPKELSDLAGRLRVDRGKFPQPRVISVAYVPSLSRLRIGPLRKNAASIVAHIEVNGPEVFSEVKAELRDVCEFWVLDNKLAQLLPATESRACYVYDDDLVVAQALADAMQMIGVKKAALVGADDGQVEWVQKLGILCQESKAVDAVVACDADRPAGEEEIARLRDGGVVLLLRAGALSDEGLLAARQRGLSVWRLDCGTALVAEVERLLATRERLQGGAGMRTLASGQRIVAGGVVGDDGDIIVDHCQHPRFILGEADGRGGIRPIRGEAEKKMQQWIVESWNL